MNPRLAEIRRREADLACNAAEEWRLHERDIEVTQRRLDAGGPLAAESPARVRAFVARERERPARIAADHIGFEARFGPTLDFVRQPPDQVADRAGNPVARLVSLATTGADAGFATGFMISPQLLLTNYHVFPRSEEHTSELQSQ